MGVPKAPWPKEIDLERALSDLEEYGLVRQAAEAGGVSYEWVRKHIQETVKDPDSPGLRMPNPIYRPALREAWHGALAAHVERLRTEALRRAVEGWDERPILDKEGNVVGHVRKYSDRLLELVLKRLDPEFRERFDVTAQTKDQEIARDEETAASVDLRKLSAEGRAALRTVFAELGDGNVPADLLRTLTQPVDVEVTTTDEPANEEPIH